MTPALLLLISALSMIFFRVAPSFGGPEVIRTMAGFSPLMALALCGGAFFPRRAAWGIGMAAVIVPHFIINAVQGYPLWDANLPTLIAVTAIVAVAGKSVGAKASAVVLIGVSLLSTVLFHLVTNTVSFFTVAGYAPTLAGWLQAQTTGLPQYPPTWLFSLKQLAGDLGFTMAFVLLCRRPSASARTETPDTSAAVAAPAPAA